MKGKGAEVQAVQDIPKQEIEARSPNRIRVETALSRFPIHRLAKKDTVTIDLQQFGENGAPDFKWEVTYNQKHGQPGPLAYKVDTLIVNRQIEAAGRPLPGVVKLGSLTELCAALGQADSGENRANLKKALHQNASAYITAKIRYRTKTGKEKWSEIGYTRYSVIFTGEVLPDGTAADAVYIVPNPSYRDLLNHVEVRPLDYDYLASLTPGAQRLYELLSFQMYGALAGDRPRAKLLYSEYCTHAPQARYFDFDRVKKQMYKLHVPHREAGYIGKVEYGQTIDDAGAADWAIYYTPGPKAVAEFEAFTRRQVRLSVETPIARGAGEGVRQPAEATDPRVLELTQRGVSDRKARELVAALKPDQELMDQIEYVDLLLAKDTKGRITNPPGLYIIYIRDNIMPPQDFLSSRKTAIVQATRDHRKIEEARRAKLRQAYETYLTAETERYIADSLTPNEYAELLETHRRKNLSLLPHLTPAELLDISHGTVRSEIRHSGWVRVQSLAAFEMARADTPNAIDIKDLDSSVA